MLFETFCLIGKVQSRFYSDTVAVKVESRDTIQQKISQFTRAKSLNVKVDGARNKVKGSPPRRSISVAVQEKVFVVLNTFAAKKVWTITTEIVLETVFTLVTESDSETC